MSESDVYRCQILTTKVDPRAVRVNTPESDVCRRQILKYKDGPRTERIKIFILTVDP